LAGSGARHSEVTNFGEMLLCLSIPSDETFGCVAGEGEMVITNKDELMALGKSGDSTLAR
jgi:hypothetical protein